MHLFFPSFLIFHFPFVPSPTSHISPQCICSFLHFLFFALLPLLSSSSSRLSFLHLSHKNFTSHSSSSHIFIPCFFSLDNPCLGMSRREDLIQQYGQWRGVLLRMTSFFTILYSPLNFFPSFIPFFPSPFFFFIFPFPSLSSLYVTFFSSLRCSNSCFSFFPSSFFFFFLSCPTGLRLTYQPAVFFP